MDREMTFDQYFLNLALAASLKSKDSTKVGAVIVGKDNQILSLGFNGFARGVYDDPETVPERYERPKKYEWTIHAEQNAIANAARHGIALNGSKLYVTHKCCKACCDLVIQAGICEVVYGDGQTVGDSEFSYSITDIKFDEAGVKVRNVKYD